MTWVKIDDRFPDHPKIIGLSDRAFRAYITGLCYAATHLTDGRVPRGLVRSREADELVSAALWKPQMDDGYEIHDYLEYNRSRAETEEIRSRRKESGRVGGKASGLSRREAKLKQRASPPASTLSNTRTKNPVPKNEPPHPPGVPVHAAKQDASTAQPASDQQATFGAICEAMGFDASHFDGKDAREVGGVAAALVAKGLHPEEVLGYVEWLVGGSSPIVSGTRLTIHSLPKWVKDFRAEPRIVSSNGDRKDRLANIKRNLEALQMKGIG